MHRSVAVAVAVLVLLVGCTPTDQDTSPSTPTPSATMSVPSASPSSSSEPEPDSWAPSGTPADPVSYANPDGGIVFASPTGNVQCVYSEYGGQDPWWGCLLIEQTVQLPAAAGRACTGTYVDGTPVVPNGISMRTDGDARPETFCAAMSDNPALAYGASLTYRDMACDSTEGGMICRSLVTGRGFLLSASAYQLY